MSDQVSENRTTAIKYIGGVLKSTAVIMLTDCDTVSGCRELWVQLSTESQRAAATAARDASETTSHGHVAP